MLSQREAQVTKTSSAAAAAAWVVDGHGEIVSITLQNETSTRSRRSRRRPTSYSRGAAGFDSVNYYDDLSNR